MIEYESLKSRIESLPEPERSIRRSFYSEQEWEHSWELNAWPHQLPPSGDDWSSWTVIGPPRSGKTEAGYRWTKDRFLEGKSVLAVFHHREHVQWVSNRLYEELTADPSVSFETKVEHTSSIVKFTLRSNNYFMFFTEREFFIQGRGYGYSPDITWGDEITDAREFFGPSLMAKKLLFTQPVRLDPDTIVSRAGDGRIF